MKKKSDPNIDKNAAKSKNMAHRGSAPEVPTEVHIPVDPLVHSVTHDISEELFEDSDLPNEIINQVLDANDKENTPIDMMLDSRLDTVYLKPPRQLPWHKIDYRAATLLARIDGVKSLREIATLTGIAALEAIELAEALRAQSYVLVKKN